MKVTVEVSEYTADDLRDDAEEYLLSENDGEPLPDNALGEFVAEAVVRMNKALAGYVEDVVKGALERGGFDYHEEMGEVFSSIKRAVQRRVEVKVREWARQQGYNVSEDGRIPARIVAEYDASH